MRRTISSFRVARQWPARFRGAVVGTLRAHHFLRQAGLRDQDAERESRERRLGHRSGQPERR
jgi:hypothetical protein